MIVSWLEPNRTVLQNRSFKLLRLFIYMLSSSESASASSSGKHPFLEKSRGPLREMAGCSQPTDISKQLCRVLIAGYNCCHA